MKSLLCLLLPLPIALAGHPHAQRTIYTYDQPANSGLSSGAAGDVDGDGIADAFFVSLRGTERLQIVSGADGSLLRSGLPLFGYLGTTMTACGDVDGDGTPDLLAGGPQSASAAVVSTLDGRVIHEFQGGQGSQLGQGLAGLGDRDGDGFADLAVGDPGSGVSAGGGSVLLFSGADGSQTASLEVAGSWAFGYAVAAAPDVNGDGVGELLVGAPWTDPPGRDRTGAAYLVSGADGAVLLAVEGEFDRGYFGASVAVAGDVDGDGSLDLLVGATQDLEFPVNGPTGYVDLRSGADGSVLGRWHGEHPGDRFGHAVAAVGDLDRDGWSDLAVAAPQNRFGMDSPGPGYVRLLSGRVGATLATLRGDALHERAFGTSFGSLGDLDGDGRAEAIVGAPDDGAVGSGRAHVLSLAPRRVLGPSRRGPDRGPTTR